MQSASLKLGHVAELLKELDGLHLSCPCLTHLEYAQGTLQLSFVHLTTGKATSRVSHLYCCLPFPCTPKPLELSGEGRGPELMLPGCASMHHAVCHLYATCLLLRNNFVHVMTPDISDLFPHMAFKIGALGSNAGLMLISLAADTSSLLRHEQWRLCITPSCAGASALSAELNLPRCFAAVQRCSSLWASACRAATPWGTSRTTSKSAATVRERCNWHSWAALQAGLLCSPAALMLARATTGTPPAGGWGRRCTPGGVKPPHTSWSWWLRPAGGGHITEASVAAALDSITQERGRIEAACAAFSGLAGR